MNNDIYIDMRTVHKTLRGLVHSLHRLGLIEKRSFFKREVYVYWRLVDESLVCKR
jgi:hypothetical protein